MNTVQSGFSSPQQQAMNVKQSGLTGRGLLTTPEFKSHIGELSSTVSECKKNLQTNSSLAAAAAQQVTNQNQSGSDSRNKFNRAASNHILNTEAGSKLQGGSKRQETSPAIMEMPSTGEVNIDDCDSLGIVTSPHSDMPDIDLNFGSNSGENSGLTSPNLVSSMNSGGLTLSNASPLAKMSNLSSAMTTANSSRTVEERKSSSSSSSNKTVSNLSSAVTTEHRSESASATQMKRIQSGDVSLEEKSSAFASASKSRLEKDGVVAEKESGLKHQSRLHRTNDTVQQESQTATMNANRLQSGGFCAENASAAVASSKSSLDSSGKFTSESHASSASSKKMSLTSGGVTRSSQLLNTSQYSKILNTKMNKEELNKYLMSFDDLDNLNPANLRDVENTLVKYCGVMSNTVDQIRSEKNEDNLACWITKVNNMMSKAWAVPKFGQDMGETLCNIMRNNGGMDLVLHNLNASHSELEFNCAKLLNRVLETDNKNYVVEKGLDKAVAVAKKYTSDRKDINQNRVGTGILENLFNHSEEACGDVIAMGGLDTVVDESKESKDVETLRHCASALANAAMYGGAENQEAMIKRNVPNWLFPLIVHQDETIKYYACLAIAVLGTNKELEAIVAKSGSLERVMPFLSKKNPAEFAVMSAKQSHGQSSAWLRRLLPVLTSSREEAKNLAAFHFCMEAEIKVKQGKDSLFQEIGAIEALKKVASSPNGIASKYAAQALRTLGEDVPHKLSQQVPTWSIDDVKEWVKQIGFANFSEAFVDSRVDGDLLLQLTEEMLREDIQMKNGILRRRFLRELSSLRKRTDYSSVDSSGLNDFLQSLGPEYSVYTYDLLNSGIDKETLLTFSDEQLLIDCGITNKIHRIKIIQGVKDTTRHEDLSYSEESLEKNLDVFISYRRSNGSQLASLLKVHLELRNYTVFLDVVGLEAGKFDNNLLQSIRSSKNFILVCTAGAMERCEGDIDQKDWIHKEIACALNSQCTIIPVLDNFVMPEPEKLPESMRPITSYNGVRWIHDYQEACIDKIDRFIRGEVSGNGGPMMAQFLASSTTGSQYSYGRQNTYQRTNSQDSNANSTRSDNTFTNGPKEQ